MSRKDYKLLADWIARLARALPPGARTELRWQVETLIGALRADNPRFNRREFLRAARLLETGEDV